MEKNFLKALVFVCVLCLPLFTHAASLIVSPSSGTYSVGDRVTVKVRVNSTTPINAVSASLTVPTNLFSIESVTKDSSVLNFWVTEPSFSNKNGAVSFEGVSLGGFSGGMGDVVSLRLRAVAEGNGSISINSAQILANDGQGTNVTGALQNGTYTVQKAEIPEVVPEKKPEPVKTEPIKKEVDIPASTPEPTQKAPALNAPEIMRVRKFGEQAIAGITQYPRAQALITFVDVDGYKVFITTTTDEKGEFYTVVPKSLKYGVYKVSAVVITPSLDNSTKSNELEVTIGSIVSDIGMWPIVGTLVVFFILAVMLIKKTITLQKGKQGVRETVKKTFKVLEDDVKRGSMKDLKEDIKDAEKVIEREVKDIGSL